MRLIPDKTHHMHRLKHLHVATIHRMMNRINSSHAPEGAFACTDKNQLRMPVLPNPFLASRK